MPQIDADAIDFIDVNATDAVPARHARAGNVTSYKSLSQFTYLGFVPHLRKEAWQCKQCEQIFRSHFQSPTQLPGQPKTQPQLEPPLQPQPQSQLRSEAQLQPQAQQSPPPQPQAQPQAEPQSQPQQQDQPRTQPPPPGQSYGSLLPNLSPTGRAPKRRQFDREAKQSAESAHRPRIPHHWTFTYTVAAPTWTFGDRYGPRKRLGGGAQGDVWTVFDALHERTMVLKTTSCCGHTPHAMLQEIAALRKTLHPDIVCMRDVLFTGQELGYVMDCARMDLRACIRQSRDQFGGLAPEMAKHYVGQVLESLAYLHED
ncbi:hypothetical protein OC834_007134, partial [Tilletia horrida]